MVVGEYVASTFQKRTQELYVPTLDQQDITQRTARNVTTHIGHRHRVEFDGDDSEGIDSCCWKERTMSFASPCDEPWVDFLEAFTPVARTVAPGSITVIFSRTSCYRTAT